MLPTSTVTLSAGVGSLSVTVTVAAERGIEAAVRVEASDAEIAVAVADGPAHEDLAVALQLEGGAARARVVAEDDGRHDLDAVAAERGIEGAVGVETDRGEALA